MRKEDQDRLWSKKMDINQGKMSKSKNLGSASNYFSDQNEKDQYKTKQEKIEYIREEDPKDINAKDQALIKYDFKDFLS
jgi:hypothetical protein